MMTSQNTLPDGYTLERTRVMWTRWDAAAMRNRISHPVVALLTEPDGYVRTFDTVRDALAWPADPDNVMTPEPLPAPVQRACYLTELATAR